MDSNKIGAIVVSVIVVMGFCVVSFLAMKPELAGVKESVVLYLLGAWQAMCAGVVVYWTGSTANSKQKDETIQKLSGGNQ